MGASTSMQFVLTAIMPAGINNNPPEKVDNGDQVVEVNEVLMFPDEKTCFFGKKCWHFKTGTCQFSHVKPSLPRLMEYLMSAKLSVDVCVYTFNEYRLVAQLLTLVNVQVRIICNRHDEDQAHQKFVDQKRWVKQMVDMGIQVRLAKPATGGLMHHKFAVIDGRLLINGSFNWTHGAVTKNHENVMITDNKLLCKPYIVEFERLWKMYAPNAV